MGEWAFLAVSFYILLIEGGIWYSFAVFLKPIADDFQWTRATISSVQSVVALTQGFSSFIGGRLADRLDPRKLLTFGALSLGIGLVLSSQISELWHFYFSYGITIGIGAGLMYLSIATAVTRSFPEKSGFALGVSTAGIGAGTMVIPVIASLLMVSYGWRGSYLILGIISLAILVPTSYFVVGRLQRAVANPQRRIVQVDKSSTDLRRDWTVWEAAKTIPFWIILMIFISSSAGLQIPFFHTAAYATDKGIPLVVAASVVGLIGVSSIFGRILMGSLSDRIGKRPVLIICFALQALTLLWLINAESTWMFYVFAVVFGFTYGGWIPLIPAILRDYFGQLNLGMIFGINMLGYGVGAAFGPYLAGYVFDVTGSYAMAFSIGTIIFGAAALLVLFARAPIKYS